MATESMEHKSSSETISVELLKIHNKANGSKSNVELKVTSLRSKTNPESISTSVVSKFGLFVNGREKIEEKIRNLIQRNLEKEERNNKESVLKMIILKQALSGMMKETNHGMSLNPGTGMLTGAREISHVSQPRMMKMVHGGKETSEKLIPSERFLS